MGIDKCEILKFLFPEWQIVKAISKKGFIARTKNSRNFLDGQTVLQERGHAVPGDANEISAKQVDTSFGGVATALLKVFVSGQEDVLHLCTAFKRPYVNGFDHVEPRNSILLIGPESRGKIYSLICLAQILKERGVLESSEVSLLNMKMYQNNAEGNLFLSDLYRCLYGQSEIVVFENCEYTYSGNLLVIADLVSQGIYSLKKRYAAQNGMLMEASGTMAMNVVDSLSANGKFFIFVSKRSEEDFAQLFGNQFMMNIRDIVKLPPFNAEQKEALVVHQLRTLVARSSKYLRMEIEVQQAVIEQLAVDFDIAKGAAGVHDYIQKQFYSPLGEYRLHHLTAKAERVTIKLADQVYVADIEGKEVILADFIKDHQGLSLNQIKEELNAVVGLGAVKEFVLDIENNYNIQKIRQSKGLKAADISMHMIFTGNPGTGKTTIARIVAKYLKAVGVLSSGQLREVTRGDLVGQYVGQTARLTAEVVKSAIGGVLFIDEAYALCRDKSDIFGIEAVDALVKAMEDNRDQLVVILAGYDQEMEAFLKTNTGLASRFPNYVNFEDYTAQEMYQIALITARYKGYSIDEASQEGLLDLFERSQIKGKNDNGNGRLVRNIIESAILKQSKRISEAGDGDLGLLISSDFSLNETKVFELEKELAAIVGLDTVKEFVRTQYQMIIARKKRLEAGQQVETTQSLNMIFTGNPGTGKTTIARMVAGMFREMGILKSGHLIEVDRGELVAEYAGQTANKTKGVFSSALGGVLFIDEAYAITGDKSGFGQECIDTLVKLIEDHRGEVLVILAGYTKEMSDFLKSNSGLKSRFPLQIEFPDYTEAELYQIALNMINKSGFLLTEEAKVQLEGAVKQLKKQSDHTSGNGRMIRNYIENIIRNQSIRIAINDVDRDEMTLINSEDICMEQKKRDVFDLEQELRSVIGLEAVKKYIRSLNARLRLQEERRKLGLSTDSVQTLHMVFKGSPGTGKTMMARTITEVLYRMGVISSNKLVETDRSGLVAGYIGQTALKTRAVIESALNGVLFIDEAYALSRSGDNDFGKEAIDTLVKMMDDNRDRLVVILAGYNSDMDQFLACNAGLKSRFPNIVEFADYTVEELFCIAEMMYEKQGYLLSDQAKGRLRQMFSREREEPMFGNGRFVRNVFERSLNNQALRLSTDDDLTREELVTILLEDLEETLN